MSSVAFFGWKISIEDQLGKSKSIVISLFLNKIPGILASNDIAEKENKEKREFVSKTFWQI